MRCGRAPRWYTVCQDPGTSGVPFAGLFPAIAGNGPTLGDVTRKSDALPRCEDRTSEQVFGGFADAAACELRPGPDRRHDLGDGSVGRHAVAGLSRGSLDHRHGRNCTRPERKQTVFREDGTFATEHGGQALAVGFWRVEDDRIEMHILTTEASLPTSLQNALPGDYHALLVKGLVFDLTDNGFRMVHAIEGELRGLDWCAAPPPDPTQAPLVAWSLAGKRHRMPYCARGRSHRAIRATPGSPPERLVDDPAVARRPVASAARISVQGFTGTAAAPGIAVDLDRYVEYARTFSRFD